MSQTTTARGRLQIPDPDLGFDTLDGGTALHTQLSSNFTAFSDHMLGRYYSYSSIANTVTETIVHNFGLALTKLKVFIFEGGSQLSEATIASHYTIAQTDTNTITVQNTSGGLLSSVLVYVVSMRLNVTSADFDPNVSITTTGTITAATLQTTGNSVILNSGASESGASWKLTLSRPTSGMTADATITFPSATSTLATLALAETLTNKTFTAVASITLVATGAIDWAAGNASVGASIGANTLTLGGSTSTVRTAGAISCLTFSTDSNDLVVNNAAAGSGADWKGTFRRPSSGMVAAAVWTMPTATSTIATLALSETLSNKTLTAVASITLVTTGAIDWAAGNASVGASIGANTLTLGGSTSTVRIAGTCSSLTLVTDSNDLVLNNAAAGSGADWKATIRRPSSGMTAAAIHTLPIATCNLVGDTSSQTLTNKIYDGGTASTINRMYIPKDTKTNLDSLTKTSGMIVWATDLKQLFVADGTSYNAVGSGGGGGGAGTWNSPAGSGAILDEEFGDKIYLFPAGSDVKLTMFVRVPSSYVAGNQINMDIGFYSVSTSGTVKLKTTAYLIAQNTDAVSSVANSRASTNSAVSINTLSNRYHTTTLDLTSSTGTINSTAVAAGDIIRVDLTRDNSDADTADTKFLPNATTVRFS